MRIRILALGLSLMLVGVPSFATTATATPKPIATAAQPGSETKKIIPVSVVLQNLHMNGYNLVKKVELENDVFDIEALTPQGEEVSVVMKADTGEIVKPKQNPAPAISLEDAVKRVEGLGFHDIFKVEYSGDRYVVRAFDQKNKKVKLKIDGKTGEVKTSWF